MDEQRAVLSPLMVYPPYRTDESRRPKRDDPSILNGIVLYLVTELPPHSGASRVSAPSTPCSSSNNVVVSLLFPLAAVSAARKFGGKLHHSEPSFPFLEQRGETASHQEGKGSLEVSGLPQTR